MNISIVTVCRNASSTIAACLASVAGQTYDKIEHIIIDGASTDSTLSIVRKFPHVRQILSEADRGVYDAMNKGLRLATGDLILFLNADDRLYTTSTIADAVRAIGGVPAAEIYYGSLEVRPIAGEPVIFHPPEPLEVPDFMVTGCLPHQSTLARRTVFERTGPFDLQYALHAEYDWYLRALADPEIRFRALPLVIGSFAEGGLSSQLERGASEVQRIQARSQLYSASEWKQRRIALLQRELLAQRVESIRLKKRITNLEEKLGEVRSGWPVGGWLKLPTRRSRRTLPPLHDGDAIVFSEDRSRSFLLEGWSNSEQWGVWSDGPMSRLGFTVDFSSFARLRCRVTPFLNRRGRQSITVKVNGRRVANWLFVPNDAGENVSDYSIPLYPARDGRYEIEFRYSSPTSPSSLLPVADTRELALGMVEAQLHLEH